MQTIYWNGSIVTMEQESDAPEAVLVREGKIAGVGSLKEMQAEAEAMGASVQMVDLGGKTLMPAFTDAHSHLSMTAKMSTAADLSSCESLEEIIETLKQYKLEHQLTKEDVLYGNGYDHNFLPGEQHPTKEYLNQVSEEIPIYVAHVSGHMGCANDAALKQAGIIKDTKDPDGGVIGRVAGSMEPNGYLEEAGMIGMQEFLGLRMKIDMDQAIHDAQKLYLQYGVTTVQDGATDESIIELFKQMGEKGNLSVDVVAYPLLVYQGQEVLNKNPDYVGTYRNHLKLGGYKAILDGSPQGKSAWLTKPYEESGDYCGYPWFQDEEVLAFMKTAVDDNRQILVHCNGDAAMDQYLRCYRQALEESTNPEKDKLRPVMIHCQTIRDDQLDQMVPLHMIPSIFVGHVYYWGDVHQKNLGEERGKRISPCESAFKKGLCVNFHQDTPVTKPDMLHSVWCAVNRVTRNGGLLDPQQVCSVYDALKAVTINAAYAYYEEDSKGSIREGKVADLVILDQNPLTVEPMKIRDIRVLATIKDGKTVYTCAESFWKL
ncbi:MAG: amidohydrolase [Hungatella sp.]